VKVKQAKILVIDDRPQNTKLLEALLAPEGYQILAATSGEDGLRIASVEHPDLILLDILMPGMSGYETCQRLRRDPQTTMLPIVMITSSGEQEKVQAIEAGADDFIARPFNRHELLARLRSLLRVKDYQDTIEAQSAQLAEWNRTLERRVAEQLAELERLNRLRRFLSPQVADMILAAGDERLLESHRREIAVVFCDLRGFTAFAETAEPEDVMEVLHELHEGVGEIIFSFAATLVRFAGDAVLALLNDPIVRPDPAFDAIRMALAMRDRGTELHNLWLKRGHQLELGIGVALGYATIGKIGFAGRLDYDAIGPVVNMAARLCDEAKARQILLAPRAFAAVEGRVVVEPVGPLTLKGFHRPIPAFNLVSADAAVDGRSSRPAAGNVLAE
jgi:adenylate cyclase